VRLFVGVDLSSEVKAAAAAIEERLRDRLKEQRLHVDARWVAAENLHITLWFIGEVDDERAVAIDRSMAAPFPVAPFELALEGCGAFPPSGPPRVFWLGVRAGAEAMRELYDEVARRLTALGFEPERRPYSAHLTLARVKDSRRDAAPGIRRVLGELPASAGTCRIEAVTLFRSHLSPKGSTYEARARVPLHP
jgi:2'-5' RNA ligase